MTERIKHFGQYLVLISCLVIGCSRPPATKEVKFAVLPREQFEKVSLITGDIYWSEDGTGWAVADVLVQNNSSRKVARVNFDVKLFHEKGLIWSDRDGDAFGDLEPAASRTAMLLLDLPRNIARFNWEVVEEGSRDRCSLRLRSREKPEFVAVIRLVQASEAVKAHNEETPVSAS